MANLPLQKKVDKVERRLPPETLIALGGFGIFPNIDIECYDLENDTWSMKFNLNTKRYGFRSIVFDEKLLLIGGVQLSYPTSVVESFDFTTGELSPMPSMVEVRSDCALAIVPPNLYAIGGNSGEKNLSTGERYNNITKKWINIFPMTTPRTKCAALVLNGEIFVVGGHSNEPLSSVEAYDPQTELWRDCSPMSKNRANLAAAVLNNYVYVFGGSGNGQYHDSAEKYDASIDKWTFIQSSSMMRASGEAIDFNETIYYAGGLSYSNEQLTLVESYDPDEDSYTTKGSLAIPRRGFNLVRVPWDLVKKSIALKDENQH